MYVQSDQLHEPRFEMLWFTWLTLFTLLLLVRDSWGLLLVKEATINQTCQPQWAQNPEVDYKNLEIQYKKLEIL